MCALVARAGAVRVRIASGRPSQAERSVGDRVEISRGGGLQHAGELGLDHEQPLVGDAGVLGGRVAHGPDQPLAAGQAGQDPPLELRVDVRRSAGGRDPRTSPFSP